ncbi:hypothetical protein G6F22_019679 [Rhizopus arrhizus]|nr:hypothetical protein G6F22_019679 [Rhizopus arrhizus]
MDRARRGGQPRSVHGGQRVPRLFQPAGQQLPARLQMRRMGGIDHVPVRGQRGPGGGQRPFRPRQIPRGQRDLGLGPHATGAGTGLRRAECLGRAAQQRFGPHEVAQLRHRDPAQRQRRRIVAQRNVVQRAQRIARRQRARRA